MEGAFKDHHQPQWSNSVPCFFFLSDTLLTRQTFGFDRNELYQCHRPAPVWDAAKGEGVQAQGNGVRLSWHESFYYNNLKNLEQFLQFWNQSFGSWNLLALQTWKQNKKIKPFKPHKAKKSSNSSWNQACLAHSSVCKTSCVCSINIHWRNHRKW